jgi:dTDP-glucose 4,6-dehydratase
MPPFDALFANINLMVALCRISCRSFYHRSVGFVKTNVIGLMNLLNAAKTIWKDSMEGKRFYHISTDECMEVWVPKDCLQRLRLTLSPYSASKASSDHFVRAYGETYGLPYVLTNCSNNYGPFFTFN